MVIRNGKFHVVQVAALKLTAHQVEIRAQKNGSLLAQRG